MKKILSFALMGTALFAADKPVTASGTYNEIPWGVGAAVRSVNVPYGKPFAGNDNESTSSFVHMLFYHGEHFYMDGTEIGYRSAINDTWSLAAFTRLRFADFPEDLQNRYQEEGYDPGLQLRYTFDKASHADLEVLTDMNNNFYGNLSYFHTWYTQDFKFTPYATLGYKSSGYNSKYYGLEGIDEALYPAEKLSSGFDFSTGVDVWYHMVSNFYLYGKAQVKFLNSEAKKSPYVDSSTQTEFWLGFAFKNDQDKPLQQDLKSKPYVRLAYGFATTSDLGEILAGETVADKFNDHMVSLFYGHPLSDTFFNLPVSIYFTPGIVWHQISEVQHNSYEIVAAMKAYYTIPLDWRVRLGVATGISYITNTTYIEDIDMDPGKKSSKLLQYLGFSADINLGDIFSDSLKDLWLGYDIHHRSAVFDSASEYGRFKGGSNYNTVYLQYHY